MTIPATGEPLTDAGPVLTIAQDLFSTMIDGEPGHLYPWMGESPLLEDARYAWVDVSGPVVTRVMPMAGRATGEQLTRALPQMDESEEVSDADFADAVGEIANVVGGQHQIARHELRVAHAARRDARRARYVQGFCLLETYFGWKGAPWASARGP